MTTTDGAQTESPEEFESATLRRGRVVARVVDHLIVGGPPFAAALLGVFSWRGYVVIPAFVLAGLWLLVLNIWSARMLATHGQTFGKRWMRLRVVRNDKHLAGFARAFLIRELAWEALCGLPSYWGYWIGSCVVVALDVVLLWSPGGRCLHDHLAGTRVIPAAEPVWVPRQ